LKNAPLLPWVMPLLSGDKQRERSDTG